MVLSIEHILRSNDESKEGLCYYCNCKYVLCSNENVFALIMEMMDIYMKVPQVI